MGCLLFLPYQSSVSGESSQGQPHLKDGSLYRQNRPGCGGPNRSLEPRWHTLAVGTSDFTRSHPNPPPMSTAIFDVDWGMGMGDRLGASADEPIGHMLSYSLSCGIWPSAVKIGLFGVPFRYVRDSPCFRERSNQLEGGLSLLFDYLLGRSCLQHYVLLIS